MSEGWKPRKYVLLAATEESAAQHANSKQWPRGWRSHTLVMTERADLYLLYGLSDVPFDVVPGTPFLGWHGELKRHIDYGRLKPVRPLQSA